MLFFALIKFINFFKKRDKRNIQHKNKEKIPFLLGKEKERNNNLLKLENNPLIPTENIKGLNNKDGEQKEKSNK
jgi:hypothetical protein